MVQGVGVKELRDVARAPLTLTLSPKGRGEIKFDDTPFRRRRRKHGFWVYPRRRRIQ
jgi:hypothetical protein